MHTEDGGDTVGPATEFDYSIKPSIFPEVRTAYAKHLTALVWTLSFVANGFTQGVQPP